jgi:hypothetical protein
MTWTPPQWWPPRAVPDAADMNAGVRDNFLEMVTDNSWTAPTLLNGWVNYGLNYEDVGYKRQGGFLMLRGLIKNGTTTAGTPLFNIPAPLRPTKIVPISTISVGAYARILVRADGNVTADVGADTGWLQIRGGYAIGSGL